MSKDTSNSLSPTMDLWDRADALLSSEEGDAHRAIVAAMVQQQPVFTHEQQAAVRVWQSTGWVHPMTCAYRDAHPPEQRGALDDPLHVTARGLVCMVCGYRQVWVPKEVLAGPPTRPVFLETSIAARKAVK